MQSTDTRSHSPAKCIRQSCGSDPRPNDHAARDPTDLLTRDVPPPHAGSHVISTELSENPDAALTATMCRRWVLESEGAAHVRARPTYRPRLSRVPVRPPDMGKRRAPRQAPRGPAVRRPDRLGRCHHRRGLLDFHNVAEVRGRRALASSTEGSRARRPCPRCRFAGRGPTRRSRAAWSRISCRSSSAGRSPARARSFSTPSAAAALRQPRAHAGPEHGTGWSGGRGSRPGHPQPKRIASAEGDRCCPWLRVERRPYEAGCDEAGQGCGCRQSDAGQVERFGFQDRAECGEVERGCREERGG